MPTQNSSEIKTLLNGQPLPGERSILISTNHIEITSVVLDEYSRASEDPQHVKFLHDLGKPFTISFGSYNADMILDHVQLDFLGVPNAIYYH